MSMLLHPARILPVVFLVGIAVGTALLMLPMAKAGEGSAPLLVALFTATSALSVTGLIVVDTGTYWSTSGQVVILLLIQLGGFGIMSTASLLGLVAAGRIGLTRQLALQSEARGIAPGDIKAVLALAFSVTVLVELLLAAVLTWRFHSGHGQPWDVAVWNGVFHAISAFNNAGFSTFDTGLVPFAADPVLLLSILVGVVIGGLGVPVIHDLRRHRGKLRCWSLHTKLTLMGTLALLLGGAVAFLTAEWANPATLGPLPPADRVVGALFHSGMTRTAGFNAVDIAGMTDVSLMLTTVLMIIGGGSAGTAGGIKVSTALIIAVIVWAEIRGENDATAFGRRLPTPVMRQALTLSLLAIGIVIAGTLLLMGITGRAMRDCVFEVVSAFATVGLSTGITPELPPAAQALLVVLMFAGRVGVITLATALALRMRRTTYRYPEERPIIG